MDPLGSRRALQAILGPHSWDRSEGHVICLGAGGAGTAITVNLLTQADLQDRLQRLIIVNDHQYGLDRLRSIVEQLDSTVEVEYILNTDSHRNDALLATLPEGSLVINATGMGKDRPGSPLTDGGLFPLHSVAWDLNYRGELDFLRQARAQARIASRKSYFLLFKHTFSYDSVLVSPSRPQLRSSSLAIRKYRG